MGEAKAGLVLRNRAGKGVRKIRAITLIENNYKSKEELLTGSFNNQTYSKRRNKKTVDS